MDTTAIDRALSQLKTALESVDPDGLVVSCDRDSDSLVMQFFGRGIPAVSLQLSDEIMLRWDRVSDRLIGIHFEHFIGRVAPVYPALLDLLDIAELSGLTSSDVGAIRREIVQDRRRQVIDRAVHDIDTIAMVAD